MPAPSNQLRQDSTWNWKPRRGAPLFPGLMYPSVGSYITRACRGFDSRFTNHPPLIATAALSVANYANFFLHHFLPDFGYALIACIALMFRRCMVYYTVERSVHRMPFLVAFTLIAAFIWFAENAGTFSHAWLYPSQMQAWSMVSVSKLDRGSCSRS